LHLHSSEFQLHTLNWKLTRPVKNVDYIEFLSEENYKNPLPEPFATKCYVSKWTTYVI
jgi:hypothetical protein